MTRYSSTKTTIRLLLAVLASCSFLCPATGHARSTMEIIDMGLHKFPPTPFSQIFPGFPLGYDRYPGLE